MLDEVAPRVPPPASPRAHIAVLVSLNFPGLSEPVAELVRRFTRVAVESLHALGASYTLFDTSHALPDPGAVADCDGLLLLGGGDLDPRSYGEAHQDVPNSYGVDQRADDDGLAAIAAALSAERPVLGICRGAQLLNVAYGGTIIPDIDDFGLHRGGHDEDMFLNERILIHEGSRLRGLLHGVGEVVGRSGHHQAVDRVGAGLEVCALALDGIVEGIEDPTRWVVGVQWHPEDDDGPEGDRLRLFDGFIDACRRRETIAECCD